MPLDFEHFEHLYGVRVILELAAILRAVLARKTRQAGMLLGSHIEASTLELREISLPRLHIAHRDARATARCKP